MPLNMLCSHYKLFYPHFINSTHISINPPQKQNNNEIFMTILFFLKNAQEFFIDSKLAIRT